MRKILYLPIEIKKRELLPKLFLGFSLIAFEIISCTFKKLTSNPLQFLASGIYFCKLKSILSSGSIDKSIGYNLVFNSCIYCKVTSKVL